MTRQQDLAAALGLTVHRSRARRDITVIVIQRTLARVAVDEPQPHPGEVYAKSPRMAGRHERPFFRHELAGTLALDAAGAALLDGVATPDLVVYVAIS